MRRLVWFGCAWTAAAFLAANVLPQKLRWIGAVMLLAGWAATLVLRRRVRRKWLRPLACVLLGAALSLGWFAVYDQVWYAGAQRAAGETGNMQFLLTDSCTETRYGGGRVMGRRYGDGPMIQTCIYLDTPDDTLQPGMVLVGRFELTLSADTSSGDYFDSCGVFLVADQAGNCVAASGPGWARVLLWPRRLARRLSGVLDACFDEAHAPFFRALVLGDRSGLDDGLVSSMKRAGIYHALAVSGLHVNLVVSVIALLCRRRRRLLAAVGIPAVLVFMVMTGASPSVCRAAVMEIAFLLAALFGRDYDALTALFASVLVLLIPEPHGVMHTGLQLSVGSVAGLVLFADRLDRAVLEKPRVARWETRHPLRARLLRPAVASGAASCSAMVFTMPVMAAAFGTVSLVAPLTNLLALWMITILFVSGAALSLLGLVWLPGAKALAWLPALGMDYVSGVCKMLSGLHLSCLYTISPAVWMWLGFLYLALVNCALFGMPRDLRIPVGCAVITLCAAIAVPVLSSRSADCDFRVLDVGQGQSILMTSGSTSALIDCGGGLGVTAGDTAANWCITKGEYRLDLLILTHYDTDHVGGVEQLLSRVRVKQALLPEMEPGSAERGELEEILLASGAQVDYIDHDRAYRFGSGRLRLFAPGGQDDNDGLAVLATFGETDFLITGDMDADGEAALVERYAFPQVEYLVAGHHGSKNSTSQALLECLRPEAVLISAGVNSYGLPADETLWRIHDAGAEACCTVQCGTITIRR